MKGIFNSRIAISDMPRVFYGNVYLVDISGILCKTRHWKPYIIRYQSYSLSYLNDKTLICTTFNNNQFPYNSQGYNISFIQNKEHTIGIQEFDFPL